MRQPRDETLLDGGCHVIVEEFLQPARHGIGILGLERLHLTCGDPSPRQRAADHPHPIRQLEAAFRLSSDPKHVHGSR